MSYQGYSAYDKLSPAFRSFLDGKTAIYRSAHAYIDRENPAAGPKFVEREHPLVRVHPATGWKSLWVNRAMTVRIVGLDKPESGELRLLMDFVILPLTSGRQTSFSTISTTFMSVTLTSRCASSGLLTHPVRLAPLDVIFL